jgi:hypothetical protein
MTYSYDQSLLTEELQKLKNFFLISVWKILDFKQFLHRIDKVTQKMV